jgi:hypothetical protein
MRAISASRFQKSERGRARTLVIAKDSAFLNRGAFLFRQMGGSKLIDMIQYFDDD